MQSIDILLFRMDVRARGSEYMRGTYVLAVGLEDDELVEVGALGKMRFPAGCYVYVGSAQGGIERRVARHKSNEKRFRWHIDYLLEKGTVLFTVAIPLADRSVECRVASLLMDMEHPGFRVSRFGCSDCRCRTHLVYLGPPDDVPAAMETLNYKLSTLGSVYPAVEDPCGPSRDGR